MSTVVVTITTKKQTVPSSPAASNTWRFKLLQAGVLKFSANVSSPASLSATFSGVPDGDYTANVQRLDMSGNPIGDAASTDFTVVTAPVVSNTDIDVPNIVNVSVS